MLKGKEGQTDRQGGAGRRGRDRRKTQERVGPGAERVGQRRAVS